jgi:chromosome segregation ATPase
MKNLIGVIILAVVCLGLAVVLISTKKQATVEKLKDVQTILYHSNELVKTTEALTDQRQVNTVLTNDLTSTRTELSSTRGELSTTRGALANLTNKFTAVAGALSNTEATLKASQTAVAMRDQRIAALETQNRELDDKAISLSAALTNLTTQIEDTQRKLTASEGDKAFLEKELKRMMAEKAELERQFNDLAVLRAQVSKLKEELSIARRLDWLRKGLFSDEKGAQKLMQGPPQIDKTNQFDLNVEVNADGSVSIIPPLTNAPAAPK